MQRSLWRKAAADIAHLRSPFRVKAADIGADGTFSGYGSVFHVVDSGLDYIVKGAFAGTLKRHAATGTRPKMLWQHYHDQPIGSWLEMREDDHGLWCKGQLLLEVEKGREAYVLMKAGELDGLSIGYECTEWENARGEDLQAKYGGPAGYAMPAGQVRVLKQLDLWEISPVTFPMNEAARVETVKAKSQPIDLTSIKAALDRRAAALS